MVFSRRILNTILIVIFLFAGFSLKAQSNDDCMECHSDESLSKKKAGKKISLFVDEKIRGKSAHAKVNCIACHTGFDPEEIPHKEKITPVNCVSCHNKELTKHAFHPNIMATKGTGWSDDANCKTCHGTHDVASTKVPGNIFHKDNLVNGCGSCHKDVKEDFIHSAHAEAQKRGDKNAPTCIQCHSSNITHIAAGMDSLQLKVAQAKVCMSCHVDNQEVSSKTLLGAQFVRSFEKSVHGQALKNGKAEAANCVDCHGSHTMNKAIVDNSPVNKMHIPETCAKCHKDIANDYNSSIHGNMLHKGSKDAPGCTDCHGEHDILKHDDPKSPVSSRNVSQQVCGTCHASVKLSKKYGIASDRFQTFSDSYHGLSVRGGALEVVNCASCHGAHNIKQAKDSTSTISKANLVKTCGKCHPGAGDRFTIGSVHSSEEKKADDPLLWYVATIYLILIFVVVGGMALHNIIDLHRKVRRKLAIQRGELHEEEHHGRGLYVRMTASERLQHGTMALSFIMLVITGFMLRYPDAWWVVGIRSLSEYAFEARSILHRVAGIAMVVVSLYHLWYIIFTVRGRQLVKDLWFCKKDWADAVGILKYNLGISKDKPRLGRFSYVEKSEYWALVWGTIVMALTGTILWFEVQSIDMITKLGWDVSRIIHFYEAILATLAIIVWHFYFVIFNPDVYPMSLAWLTGKISEKEMAHEHPLELEAIKKSEEANRPQDEVIRVEQENVPDTKTDAPANDNNTNNTKN